MKRPRHKKFRPKFAQSPDPVGLAGELPDLCCDRGEHLRRPDFTVWLALRPHVFGAIAAAAKLIAARGETPTTETIAELVGGCYSREVIEIAAHELKKRGWEAPT
jgi:hypothetical protein